MIQSSFSSASGESFRKLCSTSKGSTMTAPGRIGWRSPSISAVPSPCQTKITSRWRSCACSRMWEPGATTCTPSENGPSQICGVIFVMT